ncbi:hypothetical protein MHYP_G00125660 [Metynnis hypsauchen]
MCSRHQHISGGPACSAAARLRHAHAHLMNSRQAVCVESMTLSPSSPKPAEQQSVGMVTIAVLLPGPGSAAAARRCGSIYKGFAQCLLALGDSLSVSSQKDDDTQEIDSICRSWDDFHDCANLAMAGCPEEAAAVWESLRQESKKMQFSDCILSQISIALLEMWGYTLIDLGAAGNFTDQKVVKNGEPHWNTGSTPLTIKVVDNQPLEEGKGIDMPSHYESGLPLVNKTSATHYMRGRRNLPMGNNAFHCP